MLDSGSPGMPRFGVLDRPYGLQDNLSEALVIKQALFETERSSSQKLFPKTTNL